MDDPEKNRRDFPAPWVRLGQVVRLMVYGPILVLLGVLLLLHLIANRQAQSPDTTKALQTDRSAARLPP
jgi:hypothetical protein